MVSAVLVLAETGGAVLASDRKKIMNLVFMCFGKFRVKFSIKFFRSPPKDKIEPIETLSASLRSL